MLFEGRSLMERSDFDGETIREIGEVFHRRLDYEAERDEARDETPPQRAARLKALGRLDEESVADALGMRDRDFVLAALAQRSGIALEDVVRIVNMKAAKPVIAVCWRAELSMRLALRIQKELCHIPPRELVYPREGTDYPLGDDEMNWQLEFLGLEKKR
ncbi:MAG: DUF2336 domain-containing protein [Alphaproteobacteria bacterium]|nr:DUF2336 domain-containing protein [Alphaproteobacteria bacterium]